MSVISFSVLRWIRGRVGYTRPHDIRAGAHHVMRHDQEFEVHRTTVDGRQHFYGHRSGHHSVVLHGRSTTPQLQNGRGALVANTPVLRYGHLRFRRHQFGECHTRGCQLTDSVSSILGDARLTVLYQTSHEQFISYKEKKNNNKTIISWGIRCYLQWDKYRPFYDLSKRVHELLQECGWSILIWNSTMAKRINGNHLFF